MPKSNLSKLYKKSIKQKSIKALKKSRPKRYMNAFLCFCHEERRKFKNGLLLPEWRRVHKGLGKKWRALGVGKEKYKRNGNLPAFAVFIKEDKSRREILPEWIRWHRGLGERWRTLDRNTKDKFRTASQKMKGPYKDAMAIFNKEKMLVNSSTKISKLQKTQEGSVYKRTKAFKLGAKTTKKINGRLNQAFKGKNVKRTFQKRTNLKLPGNKFLKNELPSTTTRQLKAKSKRKGPTTKRMKTHVLGGKAEHSDGNKNVLVSTTIPSGSIRDEWIHDIEERKEKTDIDNAMKKELMKDV